jgi:hypothetical protein
MCEVSFDSFECYAIQEYEEFSFTSIKPSSNHFHEQIFVPNSHGPKTLRAAINKPGPLETEARMRSVAQTQKIAPTSFGGSGELNTEITWGGKNGTKISVGVEGKIHDQRGNYVKGSAQRESSGEGYARIYAGHEEDVGKNKK